MEAFRQLSENIRARTRPSLSHMQSDSKERVAVEKCRLSKNIKTRVEKKTPKSDIAVKAIFGGFEPPFIFVKIKDKVMNVALFTPRPSPPPGVYAQRQPGLQGQGLSALLLNLLSSRGKQSPRHLPENKGSNIYKVSPLLVIERPRKINIVWLIGIGQVAGAGNKYKGEKP
jgi:hypothetical protein